MRPTRNQILFKPFPPQEKTQGGLFVPDSVKEENNRGVVVCTGPQVKNIKEGDVAYRVKGWGEQILMNGEKYYLMEETAILAKE